MRKMVLAFLRQVLGVPDPDTGLAGTGCLIVSQFAVQCLDQLYPFAQRSAENCCRFFFEISEVLQAFGPFTFPVTVAVIAAFTGCLVEVVVLEVALFNKFLNQ